MKLILVVAISSSQVPIVGKSIWRAAYHCIVDSVGWPEFQFVYNGGTYPPVTFKSIVWPKQIAVSCVMISIVFSMIKLRTAIESQPLTLIN